MEFGIDLKRVFLSFAQALFRDTQTGYRWQANPLQTQILITDQYAVNPEAVPEKLPAVIFRRGGIAWGNISIDQRMSMNIITGNILRSDLVRAMGTYICLAAEGYEAEKVANILATNLMARKDEFRKGGIHKVVSLGIGEERMVRGDASPRAFEVSVNVGFTAQQSIFTQNVFDTAEVEVAVDGAPQELNYDYVIHRNDETGTSDIVFLIDDNGRSAPADGAEIVVTYIDNITLEEVTDTFTGDGETIRFSLSRAVYGYYPLFMRKKVDVKVKEDEPEEGS